MTTTPAQEQGGAADVILQMRSITKTFPGVKALSEVSLSVRRGEVHAICGENGAGKSTLMKVLSGVYPHGTYEGDIVYEGQVARFGGITDSEHAGVVIIHQELALVPYLSIAENIFLGNEVKGRGGLIDWNRANGEAGKLLRRVGLAENATTPVGQLGVGKQQLVEIAKALTKDVKLLILDEPTAALNDNDSEHLLGLLRQLQAEGITCIIISHKLNEIIAIAQSTTIIRDGRTIETLDIASGEVTQERIIRGMVGRDLESRFPERESSPGEEVLRVEDWTVGHPTQDRLVVDGASFSVRAGEVIGIAGLMGAGRTELAMSVFGRSYGRYLGGRLYKRGEEIQARTVREAIKHGIAYATEDRKKYGLNLIDDIKRNVSAAALDKLSSGVGLVNAHEEIKVAEDSRRSMNIKAPTVMSTTGKLSGGNQQKVVLSKWIYADPDVLILDEPTRGIDVGAKYEIYVIINKLVAAGKAVIVISSELPELLGTCDRVYTLSQGRITGDLPIREASQERLMELMTQERVPARAPQTSQTSQTPEDLA